MGNILFLNHKQKQCGVYQYGYRTCIVLVKSKTYSFVYCEVDCQYELNALISKHNPIGIIYNYHPATMGWINGNVVNSYPTIVHYGIHHEGDATVSVGFNNLIMTDSSFIDTENKFSTPRPLFENHNYEHSKISNIPVIGSFGFGFHNKGFERLVKLVNDEFDEAVIRLHIPFAFYGDSNGDSAKYISAACSSHIKKENIKLIVTHDFLTDEGMLNFLQQNTINAFLYDEMIGRGLSSVIDYALSVDVPIAITKTYMFRHISNTNPSICVEDRSLKEIIKDGTNPMQIYRDMYSNANLINKYESILNKTIKK